MLFRVICWEFAGTLLRKGLVDNRIEPELSTQLVHTLCDPDSLERNTVMQRVSRTVQRDGPKIYTIIFRGCSSKEGRSYWTKRILRSISIFSGWRLDVARNSGQAGGVSRLPAILPESTISEAGTHACTSGFILDDLGGGCWIGSLTFSGSLGVSDHSLPLRGISFRLDFLFWRIFSPVNNSKKMKRAPLNMFKNYEKFQISNVLGSLAPLNILENDEKFQISNVMGRLSSNLNDECRVDGQTLDLFFINKMRIY